MIEFFYGIVLGITVGSIVTWRFAITKAIEYLCEKGYIHYNIRNGTHYLTKLEDV
jgi:hypothetical protein